MLRAYVLGVLLPVGRPLHFDSQEEAGVFSLCLS